MKILVIGFIVLFGWSALSTHIYVCNIKGLCNEPVNTQTVSPSQKIGIDTVTSAEPSAIKREEIAEDLVIHFEFDKSDFISDAAIDKYLDESIAHLDKNLQARLSITGYTDAVGTDEYNQALGYRRAVSVQHYFESKGIPSGKIIIGSRGEKEPADDNNTSAGRANNRRAAITIKN